MIELLSSETIQKIAAGEVIERPGSIVKELVENSIDAQADSITVEIKDGGKSFIQIIDNGTGIEKEDLLLAFQRHATSKIKQFDELYEIYSLGFRGEALASVIAAADVKVKTKTEKDKTGSLLEIQNGNFSEITPIAMNTGTIIEITKLFDSIPVRKKFLRKDSTEANVITNMMYRFALANSDISFKYIKDNRIVFETVKGSLKEHLRELFDSSLADNMIQIDIKGKDFSLKGLTSNNNYYRGNRGLQYLFINGRYVENKEIQKSIEDNYISIIPNGKYPVFQLFLEISPALIDVNIHPNKQKVKIKIIDEILEGIKEEFGIQLRKGIEIPDIGLKKNTPEIKDFGMKNHQNFEKEIIEKVYENSDSLSNDSYNLFSPKNISKDSFKNEHLTPSDSKDFSSINTTKEDFSNTKEFIIEENPNDYTASQIDFHQDHNETENRKESTFPEAQNCKIIGILFNTYILFREEGKEELYLLDQHAAHERILFEEFKKKYNKNSISSQQLVSPIILTIKNDELKAFEENKELFTDLGYEIDLFDDSHLILRSFPMILGNIEGEKLLLELLDSINSNSSKRSIRDKIIMKSCKAAVKAGDHLSDLEIESLLKQLERTDYPYTCPHGRPTLIQIKKTDIEKIFSRIK